MSPKIKCPAEGPGANHTQKPTCDEQYNPFLSSLHRQLSEGACGEIRTPCPKCRTGEEDTACSVNWEKREWYCYRCKEEGRLTDLIGARFLAKAVLPASTLWKLETVH